MLYLVILTDIDNCKGMVMEKESTSSEASSEGDKLSPFTNSDIGYLLVHAALDFVLRTAVSVDCDRHQQSEGSEGDFADLKGIVQAGVYHRLVFNQWTNEIASNLSNLEPAYSYRLIFNGTSLL